MCLFATTQEALIAKEDIKVYKVVIVKADLQIKSLSSAIKRAEHSI